MDGLVGRGGATIVAGVGLGVAGSAQEWLVPVSCHGWRLAKFGPPQMQVAQCGVAQRSLPLGPAHVVGTSYTPLYTLGEDVARPFGPAHVRSAYFF